MRLPDNYIKLTPQSVMMAQSVYQCWSQVERGVISKYDWCSHLILHGVAFTYEDKVGIIPVAIGKGGRTEHDIIIWLDSNDLYLTAPETHHHFVDKIITKITDAIGGSDVR